MILSQITIFDTHFHIIVFLSMIKEILPVEYLEIPQNFYDKEIYNPTREQSSIFSNNIFQYEDSIKEMYDETINKNNGLHPSKLQKSFDIRKPRLSTNLDIFNNEFKRDKTSEDIHFIKRDSQAVKNDIRNVNKLHKSTDGNINKESKRLINTKLHKEVINTNRERDDREQFSKNQKEAVNGSDIVYNKMTASNEISTSNEDENRYKFKKVVDKTHITKNVDKDCKIVTSTKSGAKNVYISVYEKQGAKKCSSKANGTCTEKDKKKVCKCNDKGKDLGILTPFQSDNNQIKEISVPHQEFAQAYLLDNTDQEEVSLTSADLDWQKSKNTENSFDSRNQETAKSNNTESNANNSTELFRQELVNNSCPDMKQIKLRERTLDLKFKSDSKLESNIVSKFLKNEDMEAVENQNEDTSITQNSLQSDKTASNASETYNYQDDQKYSFGTEIKRLKPSDIREQSQKMNGKSSRNKSEDKNIRNEVKIISLKHKRLTKGGKNFQNFYEHLTLAPGDNDYVFLQSIKMNSQNESGNGIEPDNSYPGLEPDVENYLEISTQRNDLNIDKHCNLKKQNRYYSKRHNTYNGSQYEANRLEEVLESDLCNYLEINDAPRHKKRSSSGRDNKVNVDEKDAIIDSFNEKNSDDDDNKLYENLQNSSTLSSVSSETYDNTEEFHHELRSRNEYVDMKKFKTTQEDTSAETVNIKRKTYKGVQPLSKPDKRTKLMKSLSSEFSKITKTVTLSLTEDKFDESEGTIPEYSTISSKKNTFNKKLLLKGDNKVTKKPGTSSGCHPSGGPPKFNWCCEDSSIGKDQQYEDALRGKIALHIVEVILKKVYKSSKMTADFGFCKGKKKPNGNDNTCNLDNSILNSPDLKEIMASMDKMSCKACNQLPEKLKDFLEWLVKVKSARSIKVKSPSLEVNSNCSLGDSAFLFHKYDLSAYDDDVKNDHGFYNSPYEENSSDDYEHTIKNDNLLNFNHDFKNDLDAIGVENEPLDLETGHVNEPNIDKMKRFAGDQEWNYPDSNDILGPSSYLRTSLEERSPLDYSDQKNKNDFPVEKLEQLVEDMKRSNKKHIDESNIEYSIDDNVKHFEQNPFDDLQYKPEDNFRFEGSQQNYDDISSQARKKRNNLDLNDLMFDSKSDLKAIKTDPQEESAEGDKFMNYIENDESKQMMDEADSQEEGFYTPVILQITEEKDF